MSYVVAIGETDLGRTVALNVTDDGDATQVVAATRHAGDSSEVLGIDSVADDIQTAVETALAAVRTELGGS